MLKHEKTSLGKLESALPLDGFASSEPQTTFHIYILNLPASGLRPISFFRLVLRHLLHKLSIGRLESDQRSAEVTWNNFVVCSGFV